MPELIDEEEFNLCVKLYDKQERNIIRAAGYTLKEYFSIRDDIIARYDFNEENLRIYIQNSFMDIWKNDELINVIRLDKS